MSRPLNFGFSLKRELERAGFTDPRPDSLYMEARKRAAP